MIKNQQINIFKGVKRNILAHTKIMLDFCKLEENFIFLDIGTNLSIVTDEILKLNINGKIHCFECHPMLYSKLQEKHKHNKNVILNNVAVSNTNSKKQFYHKKNKHDITDNGSTLKKDKINITDKNNYSIVDTIKLSDYIKDFEKVDVLKLDVEGSEYDILQDLINSNEINKIKYIFFECHAHKVPSLNNIKYDVLTKLTELNIKTYHW
jgi:FkbM family methyltransferase